MSYLVFEGVTIDNLMCGLRVISHGGGVRGDA
jgi:hypothetical protein